MYFANNEGEKMIHIGFPLYDSTGKYSKYEAVALLSLLSNTKSEITIHIIHDDSVSENVKERLKKICDDFSQKIVFHKVNSEDFSALANVAKGFTIGTLFRLKLPELMDESISKILFLDADLLINTDIKPIWELDVTDYYVAACHDDGLSDDSMMMSDGLVPASKYYNAGVVIFNLKKIRQDFDLFNDSAKFLIEHPNCPLVDQDAANYFFMDNVLYLDSKYNVFTSNKRGKKLPLEDCIYHYAADYVCLDNPEEFDRKYIDYMSRLHWDNNGLDSFLWGYTNNEHAKVNTLQVLCKWLSDGCDEMVMWGAGSIYLKSICEFVNISTIDYFVDKNKKMQETTYLGKIVRDPEYLVGRNKAKIIVVSKKYYGEIKTQLESYGYKENTDFIDGMLLLSQTQGGRVNYY